MGRVTKFTIKRDWPVTVFPNYKLYGKLIAVNDDSWIGKHKDVIVLAVVALCLMACVAMIEGGLI